MLFGVIAEYNYQIKRYDKMINDCKKYIEEHPKDIVGHKNLELLEFIRTEIESDLIKRILAEEERYSKNFINVIKKIEQELFEKK